MELRYRTREEYAYHIDLNNVWNRAHKYIVLNNEPCVIVTSGYRRGDGTPVDFTAKSMIDGSIKQCPVSVSDLITFIRPDRHNFKLIDINKESKTLIISNDPKRIEIPCFTSDFNVIAYHFDKGNDIIIKTDGYVGTDFDYVDFVVIKDEVVANLKKKVVMLETEIKCYPEGEYILETVKERFEKQDYKV